MSEAPNREGEMPSRTTVAKTPSATRSSRNVSPPEAPRGGADPPHAANTARRAMTPQDGGVPDDRDLPVGARRATMEKLKHRGGRLPDRRFDWFKILALIPLGSLVYLTFFVRRFDGWGSWAAAPLLLTPILLSLPTTIIGVLRIVGERRAGAIRRSTAALTLVAAAPILWILWRFIVTA